MLLSSPTGQGLKRPSFRIIERRGSECWRRPGLQQGSVEESSSTKVKLQSWLRAEVLRGSARRSCGGSCSWLWLVPYVSPEVGSWGPARWVTGTWGHTSPAAPGQAGAGPHSHITWAGRVLGALVPT